MSYSYSHTFPDVNVLAAVGNYKETKQFVYSEFDMLIKQVHWMSLDHGNDALDVIYLRNKDTNETIIEFIHGSAGLAMNYSMIENVNYLVPGFVALEMEYDRSVIAATDHWSRLTFTFDLVNKKQGYIENYAREKCGIWDWLQGECIKDV